MKKWNFYTTNEIKPAGWMKRQLELQAHSLSGNLDKVWPDVRDSAWIGGNAEGWERVPYWLDGFIPVAYLLEDQDMIARAKKYIDAIIAAQKEDGWICPCDPEKIAEYDTWAVQLITKVLTVYYECSGDSRIPSVLYKALKNYYDLLSNGTIKLFDWGKARWYEAFIALNFLHERYEEDWIQKLAHILKEQCTDYSEKAGLWERPLNKWTYDTHIVNLTMMLKAEAVSHDLLHEEYTDKAEMFRTILDRYNGTPVDLFTGDECLSGLSPIQGTELCSVAEQMYSYELLYAYTGDAKWAERLETIAFNALPATISDDMWAHQYVQQSNQISCQRFPGKSLFRTNGPEAHIFGLEPNFGCCTANFNQAWPKFLLSTFMYTEDSIINVVPIPSRLEADGVSISLETEYPFKNTFVYTIRSQKNFDFRIRIPSFAENVKVDGALADKAEYLHFAVQKGEEKQIHLSFETKPFFMERPHNLKTVKCGSLVFSLPIAYEKVMLEYERDGVERKFPYCDYEYVGKSDWNYGYADNTLQVVERPVAEIPFSSENPPIVIQTKAAKIPWELEDGYETVCAKTPVSAVAIGETQDVTLYPYGCAKLRMTEMPMIEKK